MNGTARKVLMLTVVVAVGMVLMTPIVDTVNNNTGQQTVTNETVNATYGERLDLQGYQINEGSETVYGYNESSDTYEVAPEDDYTLHYESGQITLNSSSTLIDTGENVRVTYDYQATSELTSLVLGFIPVMIGVLLLVVVASRVEEAM